MLESLPDVGLKTRVLGRLESRDATVGVVGLGYVGLPLALAMVNAGYRVIGIDRDERRVADVVAGHSPIEDISSAATRATTGA